jgi:hypothetical protein
MKKFECLYDSFVFHMGEEKARKFVRGAKKGDLVKCILHHICTGKWVAHWKGEDK